MTKYYTEYYFKKSFLQILKKVGIVTNDKYQIRLNKYRSIFIKKNKSIKENKIKKIEKNIYPRYRCIAPSIQDFIKLKRKSNFDSVVDVIIPVYKGVNETLRCIYSVLNAKSNIKFDLIVINDASPEKELVESLSKISKNKCCTYIEHKTNIGFVKSMNEGMRLHPDRDVLWLNSDTEVFDYFLDRLYEVAYLYKDCGTVTPISNNASIASYPFFNSNFNSCFSISDREIDKICIELNNCNFVTSPTGHGFCLFIKRQALNKVGNLDPEFNQGYCEENDLSQRMENCGFKNLITPYVFVRHFGSISFGQNSNNLTLKNLDYLSQKHPLYLEKIKVFIKTDPLKTYRVKIDAAIWRKSKGLDYSVLHIVHNRGGGTHTFINNLAKDLQKNNIGSLVLVPEDLKICKILRIDSKIFPNMERLDYSRSFAEIEALIRGANVRYIHIHSILEWGYQLVTFLSEIKKQNPILKIVTTIHDYAWCCSAINLYKNSEICSCDQTEPNCKTCDVISGRSSYLCKCLSKKIFLLSDKVTVPDYDVKERMSYFFPNIRFINIPHSDFVVIDQTLVKKSRKNNKFVIGVVGSIREAKGYYVIENLNRFFIENKINAECVVIGYTFKKSKIIKTTGRYNQNNFINFVNKISPDIWFQPAVWPETYSYTLSEMLCTGIPVSCFDIGAPKNRLQKLNLVDNIIPISEKNNAKFIYEKLMNIVKENRKVIYKKNITNVFEYYGE